LAESHKVDESLAVPTSATREAENGGEFLQAVTDQTGIRPRVISGTEEARLIHLAAVYGVSVTGDAVVVIDIGGGSVEVTRGSGPAVELGRSFKLGVIRLTERFVKTDPLEPRDERRLVRHVDAEIGKYLREIAAAGFERVIGTSGTILSLGTVASAADGHAPSGSMRNRRIPAKAIRQIRKDLVALDLEKRLRVPGLEPRRADLAVAGAILLDELLRRLGAQEITLCDLSLREGLVLDYIARHRKEIAQADRYPDVRRRSVFELADRCKYWPDHSQHVARLAIALFDQTRAIHGLTDREREWLEYAAILHDIGVLISYEGHHKHSYYLVKNGDLRGFEPEEIETISLVARYHRMGTRSAATRASGICRADAPDRPHAGGDVRLAESLDRSHAQSITGIEVHDRGDDDLLQLRTSGDAELELWAATRHAAPFERMTGKPIRFEVGQLAETGTPHHVEQPDATARVSGKAVRRRGHRRVRQDDAAGAAGEVAERRGPSRLRHRMELVRPGEGGDEDGQEAERADPDDVQPAARHRLR
jgi:exopolyphosphatase/guanosine-5'-triphosphate,3'-diphosphate pyrophosphatase